MAERSPEATEKHSRNARGKTTILQIINYCLGSNLPSSLRPLADDDWVFTLTLDLFGDQVSVTRSLKSGSRVSPTYSQISAPVIETYLDENGTISVNDWKFLLGLGLFGLDVEQEDSNYRISPRTLISYIFRIDAVKDPLKIIAQQPAWSWRAHVAFLLGLDWRLVRDLAKLNKESDTFQALQYATSEQLLPGVLRKEPDLLLERTQRQRIVDEVRSRLDGFRVIDDPDELINRADALTEQLRELRNESLVDRRLLDLYRGSLEEDDDDTSAVEDVSVIYEEMGLAFTSVAMRRLEDVEAFHAKLIANRRNFLQDEIERLTQVERDRSQRMQRLTEERNASMAVLQSGGALEELQSLNEELNEATSRLAEVEAALNNARQLAVADEDSRLRKAQKRQDAGHELATNRGHLDQVAARFDSMMMRLYGKSGVLSAEVDEWGYKFSLKVSGVSSTGVTRMQLLCFDLTLLAENPSWTRHPNFLVHDSSVFDGVDPRQVEAGLTLANEIVTNLGAQYICAMNSNDVPDDIQKQQWYINGVRRTVFDTDEGGILGVSF